MTLEEFASRLQKSKRKASAKLPTYTACCPAHDDQTPSFAVFEGEDGWLHVKCQKGCAEDAILGALGLSQEDRRIDPIGSTQTPETVYVYTDEKGGYLFEKARTVRNGKKTFVQRIRKGGDYEYSLKHLNGQSKTLYRLPEVLDALSKGKTIYINEGEKAADRLRSLGVAATCQPAGADGGRPESKWLPNHTMVFRGAKVVIVADRDETGEKYAAYVAGQLKGLAMKVEIVQSATLGEKDDAYDHVQAGFTVDQLIPRLDLMPRRGLLTKTVESYDATDPEYLLGTHVRKGQINLLDADGGTGKTTLVLAFAAAGSNGFDPISRRSIEPFRTLYFGSEDDGGDVRAVYESIGGKPGFLEVYDEHFALSDEGIRLIRETIEDGNFGLVAFDALIYYLHGVVRNTNDALELSPVLKKLRDVAMATGAAILNLRHTGKGTLGKSPAELGIGSVQFRNSHRSQLVMRWHPDKERFPNVRIVTHEKGSIRTAAAHAFGFDHHGGQFGWRYDVDPSVFDGDARKGSKLKDAEDMLLRELSGRYIPTKDVERMADALCISERTLNQARANLGVQRHKTGPSSEWVLHLPLPAGMDRFDPFADDEEVSF